MFGGFALLGSLSALAWLSSIALAWRLRMNGRAETALVATLAWASQVTLPTLLLGWTNELYRGNLALAVAATSIVVAALSIATASNRGDAPAEIARTLIAILRLPFDALAITWRARNAGFFGAAAIIWILGWTTWLTWLAPSIGWDGVWYHEPIVGYALQNHGFAITRVPASLEYVNGFPKACEMMNLWFVAFTDRRLIELPNTVMAVPFVLGTYVMARRYVDDAATAIGWAAAALVVPGVAFELRSTYIDVHITALLIGALTLITRPQLRLRDAWMAAPVMGMLLGGKGHGLIYVPLLGALTALRLVVADWPRFARATTTAFGVGAVVLLVGAPSYVRNWKLHHNPVWPVQYESARLHVKFEGAGVAGINNITDQNRPFPEVVDMLVAIPKLGEQHPDLREGGYGVGLTWAAFPVAIVAFACACVRVARGRIGRGSTPDRAAENLLLVAIPMLLTLRLSPAIWWARFNLHICVVLLLLTAWGTARKWHGLGQAVMGACLVSSLVFLYQGDPGWAVTRAEARQLARLRPEERAAWKSTVWSPTPDTALARDRELGPGDVIAYSDDKFAALLWSEGMRNRVEYVPYHSSRSVFLADLENVHAKWAVIMPGDGYEFLRQSPDWEAVGLLSPNGGSPWYAFRRRRQPQH